MQTIERFSDRPCYARGSEALVVVPIVHTCRTTSDALTPNPTIAPKPISIGQRGGSMTLIRQLIANAIPAATPG